MSAKYIFRLDDATANIDLKKWKIIEDIFDSFSIKPIVAVVPNNKDPQLKYSKSNPYFWKLVNRWEKKGWTIAMHGYEHIYHYVDRKKLIIPYYNKSEFGGISLNEQKKKISKSSKIFKKYQISPSVWIAPGHSFDRNTLTALKQETDIRIVSDGIALSTYYENDLHFIPQQLWEIKIKDSGIWTICMHPDTMTMSDILNFKKKISNPLIYNNTINLDEIKFKKNPMSVSDRLFYFKYFVIYELKLIFRFIKNLLKIENKG
tara:strand:+ start:15478 stop:16260 length:783 start_codon:yes stop_codon:yes gene_type:complete